jgi:hypothetical protein
VVGLRHRRASLPLVVSVAPALLNAGLHARLLHHMGEGVEADRGPDGVLAEACDQVPALGRDDTTEDDGAGKEEGLARARAAIDLLVALRPGEPMEDLGLTLGEVKGQSFTSSGVMLITGMPPLIVVSLLSTNMPRLRPRSTSAPFLSWRLRWTLRVTSPG